MLFFFVVSLLMQMPRSREELKMLRACSLLNLLSLLAEGFEGLPNVQVHYFQDYG